MKRIPFSIASSAFLLLLLSLGSLTVAAEGKEEKKELEREARVLVNLLDYIGQDYAHAVRDGKVIDEFEYEEMEEFVGRVRSRAKGIDSALKGQEEPLSFGPELDTLDSLISRKASRDRVYKLTTSLKKRVLKRGMIKVAPEEPPDLANGKKIYKKQCARCHGKDGRGNGPTTENIEMQPPPTDLRDLSYMRKVAPLKIFNTSRLGIEGTRMDPFDHLSDRELWDVAFYIKSLPYKGEKATGKTYRSLEDPPSLKKVSLSSDEKLLQEELPKGMDSSRFLAAVRLHQESPDKDAGTALLDTARSYLDRALAAYKDGQKGKAKNLAVNGYLQGIEPLEPRLEGRSSKLVDSLESKMFAVREGIKNRVSLKELEQRVEEVEVSLEKASLILEGEGAGYWAVFAITVSIIMREGLEAFLIIVAILSVLRSMNVVRARNWVHGGWILALLIGVASWWAAESLLTELGMGRIEIMEGIGALTAVLILLFVGYWLHSKSEISKWKDFVENKVQRLTNQGNMLGLAILAFIVVIREAFESVIFLSAIRIGAVEGAASAIPTASGLTLIVVLGLAYFALRFSQRLPIRTLFRVSSIMLGILAVILMGKGIHAIQESGYLTMTSMPFQGSVDLLGFYTTYETVLAQCLAILLCVFLWIQGNKPLKKAEA